MLWLYVVFVCSKYPKGLGKTVSELDVSHAAGVFEKTKFSMVLPPVEQSLKTLCNGHAKHIVLFGIEVTYLRFEIEFEWQE